MIQKSQFDILHTLLQAGDAPLTQRSIAQKTGISLGKVNQVLAEMSEAGLVDRSIRITDAGRAALEPYRVKNAVIMAAGMSSRFAPLSYEKPKALLNVKGELLIEREIRQLQEAGIRDITLVVGYLKEKMFYLADKFGIRIVVNEDYYRYNNPSTLMLVADQLDNTYICSSDNYFTENPFEQYVYRAYYSAVFAPGETDEYCITFDKKGRITNVAVGGSASWYMLGHVYFDRTFSRKFTRILRDSYDQPTTREHLWEDLYIRHIDELDLYIRKYDSRGQQYVYRHPGVGTDAYINRESEASSMAIARELGLDDTFIYMDPQNGWKISRYIEDARLLDYHDDAQVNQALEMLRKLHTSGKKTAYTFDVWKEIAGFEQSLKRVHRDEFEDMAEIRSGMAQLRGCMAADPVEPCLCHCDSYAPNFLLDRSGKMYLIDWEYSGMSDPGADLGTFIACADYTEAQAMEILRRYLQTDVDDGRLRHLVGSVAVSSFYWFLWALYQESVGKNVGNYLYIWYRYTKSYCKLALSMYQS